MEIFHEEMIFKKSVIIYASRTWSETKYDKSINCSGCMVHMKDSKERMPIVQSNDSNIFDESAVNRKISLLPTQCGTMAGDFQQQLRITAGRNAALGQYPWMVRLAYKSRQRGERMFQNSSVKWTVAIKLIDQRSASLNCSRANCSFWKMFNWRFRR